MGAIKYINVDGSDNELIATYDSENNIITETYATKTDVTVTVAANLSNLIIWRGTQSEYDALPEYDDNTLYVVTADIPYDEPVAGDVVFYDNITESKIIVQVDNVNIDDYPADRYTPIGVVVIPPSHDVYGTGEGAMISLKYMNYSDPDNGSTSSQTMYWGEYNTDTDLPNLDVAPYTGTCYSPGDGTVIGTKSMPYLPSDNFTGTVCPTDPEAYYHNTTSSSYYSAPSPYLEDGNRNPAYYQIESSSSELNCLADFNGVSNTEYLISLATGQSGWQTTSTITNNYGAGYIPAACCCLRYHTDGTEQGDWYLPAEGELGYIVARLKTINNTIQALIDTYGSDIAGTIGTSNDFWSSSEYNSANARFLDTSYGCVGCTSKNKNYRVRSFCRIGGVVKYLPLSYRYEDGTTKRVY